VRMGVDYQGRQMGGAAGPRAVYRKYTPRQKREAKVLGYPRRGEDIDRPSAVRDPGKEKRPCAGERSKPHSS
jgi:hypothetical protein